MRVLQPTKLTFTGIIPKYDAGRMLLSMLLVSDQNSVVLMRSAQESPPAFPLVEVEQKLESSLARGAYQALGVPRAGLRMFEARILGKFSTRVPGLGTRSVICIAVPLLMTELYPARNNTYEFIDSAAAFMARIAVLQRPRKDAFDAMRDMVDTAKDFGMLSWSMSGLFEEAA